MHRIGPFVLAVAVLTFSACSQAPAPVNKDSVEKTVKELESNMARTMAAKDASAFAANYAAEAVLMAPGIAPMKGTDAIRAGTAAMMADPNLKLEFSSDRVEVANSGELAATRGSYTMTGTDPVTKKVVNDKGAYVTVFRKQQDGAWKAVLDINTSENPPTPPVAKATKKKKGKKR